MNKPKIQVILASIREGRAGEKVAAWFMDAVKNNQSADLELVDLKDYPLPMFADSDAVRHREGQHPIAVVQKWIEKISAADGYIFITPEYNHGYSSALKNALDYTYKPWNNKSVAFVSYGGGAGGSRAVEQLKNVGVELQMHSIHDQVVIPMIWSAFDTQGKLANSEAHAKTANAVVDKVAALALKLK